MHALHVYALQGASLLYIVGILNLEWCLSGYGYSVKRDDFDDKPPFLDLPIPTMYSKEAPCKAYTCKACKHMPCKQGCGVGVDSGVGKILLESESIVLSRSR